MEGEQNSNALHHESENEQKNGTEESSIPIQVIDFEVALLLQRLFTPHNSIR
jgi:hypothetical protein